MVEGNFSETFTGVGGGLGRDGLGTTDPKVHGYLPFGIAWYRKHFTPPASLAGATAMYIDFDGIQTKSQVWLNGVFLGSWDYGYTVRLHGNPLSLSHTHAHAHTCTPPLVTPHYALQ